MVMLDICTVIINFDERRAIAAEGVLGHLEAPNLAQEYRTVTTALSQNSTSSGGNVRY